MMFTVDNQLAQQYFRPRGGKNETKREIGRKKMYWKKAMDRLKNLVTPSPPQLK